jgi:hypothetical protein
MIFPIFPESQARVETIRAGFSDPVFRSSRIHRRFQSSYCAQTLPEGEDGFRGDANCEDANAVGRYRPRNERPQDPYWRVL